MVCCRNYFSSKISKTYFIGKEAKSPSVWESFKSYVARVFTLSASILTEKHFISNYP